MNETVAVNATVAAATALHTATPDAIVVPVAIGALLFAGLWVGGFMLLFGPPKCECPALRKARLQYDIDDIEDDGDGRCAQCASVARSTLIYRAGALVCLWFYTRCCYRCKRSGSGWLHKAHGALGSAENGLSQELQRLYAEEATGDSEAIELDEKGFVKIDMDDFCAEVEALPDEDDDAEARRPVPAKGKKD